MQFSKKINTLSNLLYVGNPYYAQSVIKSIKKRKDANREAEKLIALNKETYTDDEKMLLARYTGQGALGVGDGDEYYTPKEVSKALFNMVDLKKGDRLLEPSCGIGSIIGQAPKGIETDGCDLNKISGSIANILNDSADIQGGVSFEEYSQNILDDTYDSVVTNVPFSKRDDSIKSKDEKYANINRSDEYFITKSLDLLKSGKRAVFLTSSSTIQRASNKNFRISLLRKSAFLGGFRLPSQMFKDACTEQVVDILVFEKHPRNVINNFSDENLKDIMKYDLSMQFVNGTYFTENKNNVFGDFTSREQVQEDAEKSGIELHHTQIRDKVTLKDGQTLDDVKRELLTKIAFNSYVDYSKLSNYSTTTDNASIVDTDETENAVNFIFEEYKNCLNGKVENLCGRDTLENKIKIAENDKRFLTLQKYLDYRLFSFNYDDDTSKLVMYLLLVDADMYDKKVIIENSKKIVAITSSFEKFVKKFKTFRKDTKNSIRSRLGILNNFDLEKGIYRETLDELKKQIEVEKRHPMSFITEKMSDIDKDKFVEYKDGILAISEDYVNSLDDINKSNIVSINGSYVSIEDFVSNSLPQSFYEATEKISKLKISEDDKKKLLSKIEILKQTLTYDDITVTTESLSSFVSKNTLLEISKKLKSDDSLITTILENIKDIIDSEYPEINSKNFIGNIDRYTIVKFIEKQIGESRSFRSGVKEVSKNVWKGDNASLLSDVRDDEYKAILISTLSDSVALIDASLSMIIDENKKYKDEINQTLEKDSNILFEKKEYGSSKLSELVGMVNPNVLPKLRHYQNEDARSFGSSMMGTIAQDTGLGKTFTMLMSALYSIRTNKSKRVVIITPNAVFSKFVNEAKIAYTKEFIENSFMSVDSKDIVEKMNEIKANKAIRIILMPHSAFDFIGLKDKSISEIYGFDKSNTDEIRPYAFKKLGIDKVYSPRNAKVYLEDIGVDGLFIDEAHFFKNSVSMQSNVKGLGSGAVSDRAIGTLYKAEYIRLRRGDRSGVVTVTATPTTNSPQEIYAMMMLNGTLSRPMSTEAFLDTFCTIEDEDYITLTNRLSSRKKLTGIKNIKILKNLGWNRTKFRDADSEKEIAKLDGKDLKVKPDYNVNNVRFKDSGKAGKEMLDNLRGAFIHYSEKARELKKGRKTSEDFSDVELDFISKYGEVFGYFNRAKIGSINPSLSLDVTPIKISKTDASEDEILSTIDDIKIEYKKTIKSIDKNGMPSTAKEVIKFSIREWYESDIYLFRKEIGMYKDQFERINGDLFLNIPTTDYKTVKKILSKLAKSKIISNSNIFNLDHFEKFQHLVDNMDQEFQRHSKSKQIIYSLTMVTHKILEDIFKEKFPKSKIFLFNGVEVNNDDKGIKMQDDFNSSNNPDILIFNEKGEVGVDFNKNVSSVHLLEIPNTPDKWHQAMGRAVRQGNDIDYVEVYRYISTGSFDELMLENLNDKASWIDSVKNSDENDASINSDSMENIFAKALEYFKDDNSLSDSEKVSKYKEIIEEKAKKKEIKIKSLSYEKMIKGYKSLKDFKNRYTKDDINSLVRSVGGSMYNRKISEISISTYNIDNIISSALNGDKSLKFLNVKLVSEQVSNNIRRNTDDEIKRLFSNKMIEIKNNSKIDDINIKELIDKIKSDINDHVSSSIDDIKNIINKSEILNKEKSIEWFDKYLTIGDFSVSEFIDVSCNQFKEVLLTSIDKIQNIDTIIDETRSTILSKSFKEFVKNSDSYESVINDYLDGNNDFLVMNGSKLIDMSKEITYSKRSAYSEDYYIFYKNEVMFNYDNGKIYDSGKESFSKNKSRMLNPKNIVSDDEFKEILRSNEDLSNAYYELLSKNEGE